MMADQHTVKIYALTTCRWCSKTKAWFDEEQISYEAVNVDTLEGDEYEAMRDEVLRVSGGRSFPVTVLDGDVIVGYKPDVFAELIKGGAAEG